MKKPIPFDPAFAVTGLASLMQNSKMTEFTVTLDEFEKLNNDCVALTLHGDFVDGQEMPVSITFSFINVKGE